ncbi:MAG: toxin-antitoxin system HicB family antitoxin [Treponema sp.]|jgi:predicted RNase H-like HicB family nuclease|nr:toxin-antitoxin system HicB family antitoxin [Treponema sp.]
MKTLEEYMKLPYKLEIVPDTEESGFVASYPELPGCITCGGNIADVVANAEDAKKAWLTAAIEDNIEIAEPESVDSYSGQFKLRLPKTLHKTLAEDSKKEGVSMNQYCVYLLAKNSEKEHLVLAKKQAVLV